MPLLLPPPNSEEQTIYPDSSSQKQRAPWTPAPRWGRKNRRTSVFFHFASGNLLPRLIPDKQFTSRGALPPTSPTYRIEATATWPCYADNSRALIIPDPAHAVEVLHQEKQAERTQDHWPTKHPSQSAAITQKGTCHCPIPLSPEPPLEILPGGKQQESGGQVCLISSQKA